MGAENLPFGSTVIFDPPPRRRAVTRLILPVLIAVAVIVALIVSASGEETRAEIGYLEEMQAQAFEISKGGDAPREVVSRLHTIDRTEFVTVIDDLRRDLTLAIEFVSEDPPTTSLLPVRAAYREALATWNAGVSGYASSVLTAADDPSNLVVVDSMADSLAELRAGDRLYRALVVEMARDDVPSPLAVMPSVVLMPAQGSLVSLSVAYVDSARSPNSGLALRPSLAISQVVTEPEWQVNPADRAVIPATESIVFFVVVTNSGNVANNPERLILTLTGGPEQVRSQVDVPSLQPNQQTTVVFEPLTVAPGGIYEVDVTLVVTGGDTKLDDNQIVVEFAVNEQ